MRPRCVRLPGERSYLSDICELMDDSRMLWMAATRAESAFAACSDSIGRARPPPGGSVKPTS